MPDIFDTIEAAPSDIFDEVGTQDIFDQVAEPEIKYPDYLSPTQQTLSEPKPTEIQATPTVTGELAQGNVKNAIGIAFENTKRVFSGLMGPTEKQRSEESIPWGTNPDGSVRYEYKPLGDRMAKEGGIFTPYLKIEPMQPSADDSTLVGAGKALFNVAANIEGGLLSPGGFALPAAGTEQAIGRVASGAFAADMLSHVNEQRKQAFYGNTPQERLEGYLGALTSLAMGYAAAKHSALGEQAAKTVQETVKEAPDEAIQQAVNDPTFEQQGHPEVKAAVKEEFVRRQLSPGLSREDEAAMLRQEFDRTSSEPKKDGETARVSTEEQPAPPAKIEEELTNLSEANPPEPIAPFEDLIGPTETLITPEGQPVFEGGPKGGQEEPTPEPTPTPDASRPQSASDSTPSEYQPGTTALKKAIVDEERRQRGAAEITSPAQTPPAQLVENGRKIIESDPTAADKLLLSIEGGDVGVTEAEGGILAAERVRVMNDQAKWDKIAGDESATPQDRAVAQQKAQESEDRMGRLDAVQRASGANWSGVGRMWASILKEDYSVDNVLRRRRAAKGGPLSETERAQATAEAEDVAKKAEAQQATQEAVDTAREDEGVKDTIEKTVKQDVKEKKGPKKKDAFETALDNAIKRLSIDRKQVNLDIFGVQVGRTVLKNALEVVRAAYKGGKAIAEAISAGIEHIKSKVKDVDENAARNFFESMVGGSTKAKDVAGVTARAKVDAVTGEGLTQKTVFEYVRALISQGMREGNEIMKAAHEGLSKVFPDITERDVRRAYVKYGKKIFPSREELHVIERELKSSVKIQEDIDREMERQRGVVDPNTGELIGAEKQGYQRDPATQKVRDLIKKRNELLKKREISDPGQLKSRDEAKQTAIRNRIADIDRELQTGQKSEPGKPAPDSIKTEALRAEKDAMQEKLNEIRKAERDAANAEKPVTPEHVQELNRILDRIDATKDRLARLEIAKKERKQTVDTPDIAAAKAELKNLNDTVEQLRNPPKTDAQKQIDTLSGIKKRIDETLSGERGPAEKKSSDLLTSTAEDLQAEIHALRELSAQLERDALPKTDKGFAEQQRKIKALKSAIAEYERKTAGRIFRSKGKQNGPDTAVISMWKDVLSARKKVYETAKKSDVIFSEEAYNMRRAGQIANELKKVQDRLKAGDFSRPTKRVSPKLDAANRAAQVKLEEARDKVERGRIRAEDSARPKWQKALEQVAGAARFSALSGYHTLLKLAGYDIAKFVEAPLTEGAGKIISKIPGARGVFERSDMESVSFLRDMKNFYVGAAVRGLKAALRVLRTGKSENSLLYGKKEHLDPKWYDFFGRLHQVEKTPLLTGTYEMYLARAQESAIKAGLDPNDEFVKAVVNKAAYDHSQVSILQENNKTAEAVNMLQGRLEAKNPKTGKINITNHVISTLVQTLLTKGIIRTPANYIAQTIARTPIGLITGISKTAVAHGRGIGNLHPTEANAIARLLKVGSVGSAFFLLGMIDATKNEEDRVFGGYWAPGRKREGSDVGWGKLRIFGKELPHLLTHNPLTESAQMGSTMMRVAISKFRKKDSEDQGMMKGAIKALVGLVSKAPIVSPAMRFGQDQNDTGTDIVSGLIPQLIQNIAEDTDSKERKPQNTIDKVKMGIPGLRQTVPEK